DYKEYVKQFVVYNPSNTGRWVGFTYTGASSTGPVTVGTIPQQQNPCITLGVSVLVNSTAYSTDPTKNFANGTTPLATYEVDITFSPS
ncbi:MAG: hypothetical protein ACP5MH_06120, partial [Thermoproteus sp.]